MCEMLIRTRVPSVCCCGLSCGVTHGTPVDGAGSPCPAGALRPRVGHSCLDVMVCRSSRGRRPRQRTFRQEPPREGPPPHSPFPIGQSQSVWSSMRMAWSCKRVSRRSCAQVRTATSRRKPLRAARRWRTARTQAAATSRAPGSMYFQP